MFIYIKIESNIMKFKFLLVLAFLGLHNICASVQKRLGWNSEALPQSTLTQSPPPAPAYPPNQSSFVQNFNQPRLSKKQLEISFVNCDDTGAKRNAQGYCECPKESALNLDTGKCDQKRYKTYLKDIKLLEAAARILANVYGKYDSTTGKLDFTTRL
jgi:hypothetical protein